MKVLDTDTLSLLFANHARVSERFRSETDEIVTTIISRIETLQGRFATLLKAADGVELRRGQERLERAESDLTAIRQLPIDVAVAIQFDRLRGNKRLKKIGRGDLLIASISLAHQAKLVTRNTRDFEQVPGLRIEDWAR
jgi:tRNA(fMet)-specific endonuclease VapC